MATKLYLTSPSPVAPDPTSYSGNTPGWTVIPPSTPVGKMSPVMEGTNTAYAATETSTVSGEFHGIRKFASAPFKRNGSVGSGITCVIARQVNSAAATFTFALKMTIHSPSGAARISVLDAVGFSAQWPTVMTGASLTATVGNSFVYTGEYMVLAIGFKATNTSSASYTGTIRAGGTAGDLVASDTTLSTTRCPHITFDGTNIDDLFLPLTAQHMHSLAAG